MSFGTQNGWKRVLEALERFTKFETSQSTHPEVQHAAIASSGTAPKESHQQSFVSLTRRRKRSYHHSQNLAPRTRHHVQRLCLGVICRHPFALVQRLSPPSRWLRGFSKMGWNHRMWGLPQPANAVLQPITNGEGNQTIGAGDLAASKKWRWPPTDKPIK